MIKKTKKIWNTIPKNQRKKSPWFLMISVITMFLDLLSIAILVPFILLILDTNSATEFLSTFLNLEYTPNYLLIGLLLLFAFYIIKNIFQVFLIKKQSYFIYNICAKISQELVQSYLYTSLINQISIDKGNLIRDFKKIPNTFCSHVLLPLFSIFSEFVFMLILLSFGLYYNATLTLWVMVIMVIGFTLILSWRKAKIQKLNESLATFFLDEMNELLNMFFGFLEIKSTKSEDVFLKKYKKINAKHNNRVAELTIFKQSNFRYFEIVVVVFVISILIYFKFITQVELSTLSVSVFASVFLKLLPSVNKILTGWLEINANYHSVDILSEYSKSTIAQENLPVTFNTSIKIENAFFKHKEKTILKDFNLTIDKGDFIYLSGKSGIGKTTALKIISGLLPLDKGTFRVDNSTIKNSNSLFFPYVGFIPQKPFIFKASLRNNITMFEEKETDIDWLQILIEKMDLTMFVNQLPNGLDTDMDVDNMKISGGQKQRIAIVRALYCKPKLLLLDESTNQLNQELEAKIVSFLFELTKAENMTIIVASHQSVFKKYCTRHIHLS